LQDIPFYIWNGDIPGREVSPHLSLYFFLSFHQMLAFTQYIYVYTYGLPRVGARALRAPVFLGSLTRKTGRCAAPAPPMAASLILSAKLMILERKPREKTKNPSLGKNHIL
jgi:hypothetical protein